MTQVKNKVAPFSVSARDLTLDFFSERPDAVCVYHDKRAFSRREVLELAKARATRLPRGGTIINDAENDFDLFVLIWAAQLAETTLVLLPAVLLGVPALPAPPTSSGLPAFVFLSSGTTGAAHYVAVPQHSHWIAAENLIAMGPRYFGDQVAFISPLLDHSYGLSSVFEYLIGGSIVLLPDRSGAPAPALQLCDPAVANQVTALEGVPSFYEQLSLLGRRARLPRLRHVGNGGGHLPVRAMSILQQEYPDLVVRNRYGLTEIPSAVACTFPDRGRSVIQPDCVGLLRPDLRVSIASFPDAALSFGGTGIGRIQIKAGADWIDSGDLGHRDASGQLFISGRSGGFLNKDGTRFSPELAEEVINMYPGVAGCRVWQPSARETLTGEAPVIAEVQVPGDFHPRRLAAFARERLPLYAVPDRFVQVNAIRRTRTGKVVRSGL